MGTTVLRERYRKGARAINDQLVVVKMYPASSTINIIRAYAPSAASEEEISKFYSVLKDYLLASLKINIIKLELGDYDAKIG